MGIYRRSLRETIAVATIGTLGFGAAAQAATTTILPPRPSEDSHEEILSQVYGVDFNPSGNDFVGGGLTAQRVDDDDDQIWTLPSFGAEVRAVFADFEQSFGYLPGEDGGSFQTVFDVTGDEYNVNGSAHIDNLSGPFRFARQESQGILAISDPEDNVDGVDHMVTYRILGTGAQFPVWLIFFEDLRADVSDFDYQDLVVEIRAVPTPAAFGAGALLLGGMLLRRSKHA